MVIYGNEKGFIYRMKAEELWENYGISDYHRLQYLGDNVDDILYILLKNIHVGVGLFEVGEMIKAW